MSFSLMKRFVGSYYQMAEAVRGSAPIGIPIGHYSAIVQGTWSIYNSASANFYSARYNTSNTNADEITWEISGLYPGSWTFEAVFYKASDRAKATMTLDSGIDLGTAVDTYAAVGANYHYNKDFSITDQVALRTLSLKVDGKNAASSDYYLSCSQMAFYRR